MLDFTVHRSPIADLGAYLSANAFLCKFSAEQDPISDNIILRFEVLGRPEVLRFSSDVEPKDIAHAAWLLRETRLAAVGPEFHMYTQLAQIAPVDPFERPV